MSDTNLPTKITSVALVSIGVALLSLNIVYQGKFNVALPLVFLLLGGGFLILTFHLQRSWKWATLFYIPALLFSTFGVIFLLNVLTNDWNAWAYAWMLLVAASGVGALLASPAFPTWPALKVSGWIMFILGMTCFIVFGAIAGGVFIQIAACILLVLAGLSIRWFRLERVLPVALQKKLHLVPAERPAPEGTVTTVQPLVEPLSNRELEVLRLIDAGLSNQQIADRLSVAPSTVKTHINNIYGKLGVDTRVQALNRARELALLDAQSLAN